MPSSAATAIAVVCLLDRTAQSAQAARATDRTIVTQDVFKSVTVLRDIPVDTFFDAMGMFANAMGNDCTFCHVPAAALDRAQVRRGRRRAMHARARHDRDDADDQQELLRRHAARHVLHLPPRQPESRAAIRTSRCSTARPEEDPNARDFTTDTTLSAGHRSSTSYLQADRRRRSSCAG